jgi:peptidylprolyl isomerase
VFHSSINHEPATFILGSGKIIHGVEYAVPGMRPGERKTVTVPAAQAYGPYLDDKVVEVPRDRIPRDTEPRIGRQYEVRRGDDAPAITCTVTAVSATTVTLDANHPLAGKDLIFEIQLLEIGSRERSRE